MFDFNQQNIIVTGGTRGIGAGITESFLKAGANVVAIYRSNEEAANKFKEVQTLYQDRLHLRKLDVSDYKACEQFFQTYEKDFATLDVLINNSGIRKDQIIASLSEENWDKVIDTNLKGSFSMTKFAVLMMMKKRYGRIVNISSIGGKLGLSGQANYAASKAGQIAMSLSVSKEVAKRNITINNICPGFIETDLLEGLPEDQLNLYKDQVPMKRFGKVSEVASAVMFLASKEASYITGASLDIAGGLNG